MERPKKKAFLFQGPRFPFAADEAAVWKKFRLNAAFSQVSRKTDLAFEDMGVLADPIGKRIDSLLKKTWEIFSLPWQSVAARNME